ncbi:MAG: 3-hydroxyacyl-ACP dehydratase FabZ [Gammaproteobacteria bacterium]
MVESTKEEEIISQLDIHEVLQHLPHRYPFLLIDRVIECVSHKSLTALKNVSYNEPYFPGHFPQRPVMPGVLILEALAQATGILAFVSTETQPSEGTLYYFVGIDEARFKRPVEPGDQLILRVELLRNVRNIWKFKTEARVDEEIVATADIMCASKEI